MNWCGHRLFLNPGVHTSKILASGYSIVVVSYGVILNSKTMLKTRKMLWVRASDCFCSNFLPLAHFSDGFFLKIWKNCLNLRDAPHKNLGWKLKICEIGFSGGHLFLMRNPFIHCFIRYIIQWDQLSIEYDANCHLAMVIGALEGIKCFVKKLRYLKRYTYIADSRF